MKSCVEHYRKIKSTTENTLCTPSRVGTHESNDVLLLCKFWVRAERDLGPEVGQGCAVWGRTRSSTTASAVRVDARPLTAGMPRRYRPYYSWLQADNT
jgi:hypothetical protein